MVTLSPGFSVFAASESAPAAAAAPPPAAPAAVPPPEEDSPPPHPLRAPASKAAASNSEIRFFMMSSPFLFVFSFLILQYFCNIILYIAIFIVDLWDKYFYYIIIITYNYKFCTIYFYIFRIFVINI